MQHLENISTWAKPSVSIQRSTSGKSWAYLSNPGVSKTLAPRGALSSRQPESTCHLRTLRADAVSDRFLVSNPSCNPSSPSTKHDQYCRRVLGPPLLTTRSGDIEEDQDLAAMVQEYIENGLNNPNCQQKTNKMMDTVATMDLQNQTLLQDLFSHALPKEEELFSVINAIILSKKDKDLAVFPCGKDCRGGCIRRSVVKDLQVLNYDAGVCSSKWSLHGEMPGGVYEYIDVFFRKGQRQTDRYIVDVDFRCQFEIARPTPAYLIALTALPVLFTGSAEKLAQVLHIIAEASKSSMRQNAMPVPPWRTLSYMTLKWLSPFERHSQTCFDNSFDNFNGTATQIRSSEQCVQQLRRLKLCLPSPETDAGKMQPIMNHQLLFANQFGK